MARELPKRSFRLTTSDRVKLSGKISGTGEPCLFVHGGPGGGFRSFEMVGGSALEKQLTMIWYDQRGSGSSQVAGNYHLDRMVQDMEEIRQKLGIKKMFLMSHSFGGIIMFAYAQKYPQYVKGLIFVNATLHFIDQQSSQQKVEYAYRLLGKDTVVKETSPTKLLVQTMSLRSELSKKHLAYKFLTDSVKTIEILDKIDTAYPRTNDFAYAVLNHLLDPTKPDLYPEYLQDFNPQTASVKIPALIITGTKDYAVGVDNYKNYQFPNQTVVHIDGGHLLYYEKNTEFVNAVFDFTQKITAAN